MADVQCDSASGLTDSAVQRFHPVGVWRMCDPVCLWCVPVLGRHMRFSPVQVVELVDV